MALNVQQGFETFLTRLSPVSSEHEKAKSHKDSVKSCMEKNFKCHDFFEIGSFGNRTGIRHHSDTDYFAVCPATYFPSGSAATLRRVREALEATFWQTTGIEVRSPTVRIPFGTWASETWELTPCTFVGLLNSPVGSKAAYNIPDSGDGWMMASPMAHNAYVKREDARLGGRVKPLIQFVKAWKYYQKVPISSFYLELRITQYAEGVKSIIYDIDLKSFFVSLEKIGLASMHDPMGISGYVRACATDVKKADALSKLSTAAARAVKAYDNREKNIDQAFNYWDLLFNGKFPGRY